MHHTSLLFYLLAGFIIIPPCHADTIRVCATNNEPYTGAALNNGGFFSEIISAALSSEGHTLAVTFMPWEKAVATAESGKSDGLLGIRRMEGYEYRFIFPEFFWETDIVLFSPKQQGEPFVDLSDLCPARTGVVQTEVNTRYIRNNAPCMTWVPLYSPHDGIEMLFTRKVDYILGPREAVLFFIKQDAPLQSNQIHIVEPVVQTAPLFTAFSKNSKYPEKYASALDQGVKNIQQNGLFQKIMLKHRIKNVPAKRPRFK